MALNETRQLAEETLRERLVGARWVLAATALGLGGASWFGAVTPGAGLTIGLFAALGAALPTRRRPVAAALARFSGGLLFPSPRPRAQG